jgi:hypothetical protein
MSTRRAFFGIAALFALGIAAPAVAKGKGKLEIASIDWPTPGASMKLREKQIKTTIRRLAVQSAKHLDFGADKAVATLVVKELSASEADGVLKVSCSLVGKLKGGGTARSKIAFGGKPSDRKKIERQVLSSVTDGVMVRLAELARAKT